MKKQRERSDKISTAFFVVLVGSVVTGVVAAVVAGIKSFMKGGG